MIKFSLILAMLAVFMTFASCGKDEPAGSAKSLVGTWVDGDAVMVLGKDGSLRIDYNDRFGQYRVGRYSYNSNLGLFVVDYEETDMNYAYQDSYIVQTLTASQLVLLYPDGDVFGYYTKR